MTISAKKKSLSANVIETDNQSTTRPGGHEGRKGNIMDKINISTNDKTHSNGDALDFSARTLDIFHHDDILLGVRNLFDCGVSEGLTYGRGLCEANYYDNNNHEVKFASIKYGATLQLTEYGRKIVLERVCFHPPMIEIGEKKYAVLEDGVHLAIKCPGIIWHDGKWCAPVDQLQYHDGGMWCDSVFCD